MRKKKITFVIHRNKKCGAQPASNCLTNRGERMKKNRCKINQKENLYVGKKNKQKCDMSDVVA